MEIVARLMKAEFYLRDQACEAIFHNWRVRKIRTVIGCATNIVRLCCQNSLPCGKTGFGVRECLVTQDTDQYLRATVVSVLSPRDMTVWKEGFVL